MDKKIGVYVHIPFCKSRCAYCNFYSLPSSSVAGGGKLMSAYKAAVIKHIAEYSAQLDGYLIDTIYFGGGTPSHFGASRLVDILDALKKSGHVLLDSEITAEINPASITKDEMIRLRRAGFNRLSIGVQCADNTTLHNLGRTHTYEESVKTIKDARAAGFKNLSVDVVYGLPSQTAETWAQTIQKIASLKAEHISCYSLKIEEGTELYAFKDSPFIPDDDTAANMYLYAVDMLSRFGYKQYEISNFARRGFESKHNMKYWLGEDYIGFGPGAHSCIDQSRYSFTEDVNAYIEQVGLGRRIVEHDEDMSDFENAGEYLMLRLRTTHGISEKEYYDIYRLKMDLVLNLLRKYEENGWAVFKDGRWRFTPKGFMISNVLIGELLEAQTKQRTQISKPWQAQQADEDTQLTLFDKRPVAAGLFSGRRLVGHNKLL
ncbi:MAG: radical SAM family heme chaperone HemW [Oscillospiraceae bacterium]|nr:radical SAM family heme chaperone HemW [Oscillospiraceae bacterium]